MEQNLAVPDGLETLREAQDSRELLRVTLSSIGDAVITTDAQGCETFLNPVELQAANPRSRIVVGSR